MRGTSAKNKDRLKPDRQKNMAGKPAANQDQFGSRHHDDAVKKEQRRAGKPASGHQDFAFRESAQETRVVKGERNRKPGRRKPK
jgi:hypothetical protein